jgi:hypothetical protein
VARCDFEGTAIGAVHRPRRRRWGCGSRARRRSSGCRAAASRRDRGRGNHPRRYRHSRR